MQHHNVPGLCRVGGARGIWKQDEQNLAELRIRQVIEEKAEFLAALRHASVLAACAGSFSQAMEGN
ncbi:hypothetical protein [Microvirga sp. CF3016]|uniref:hypothetical protein n=1 Tax=Microvirga sp. CF3016 TaxID=3110181 RepID=UPI002E798C62|nr:hypothetical protein [Microvirga sp. CF3016]MEE1611261.1 hypothetical protein [Microvirga sp. CF3016]